MSVFVLDTNIITFYLKEVRSVIENIENALLAGDELLISPIAYYEVRRGLLAIGSEKRMHKFEQLCRLFPVGQLDNRILDIAANIYAELRNKGRSINDADVFIAAFCRQHNFALVTNNTKHFENISGLYLLDWTLPPQN